MEKDGGITENRGLIRRYGRFFFGLLGAIALVALLGFVFLFLIPSLTNRDDRGWISLNRNGISLYYKERSEQETDPEELLSQLVTQRAEVVKVLDLSDEEIPEKIRIYLHPDSDSLLGEVAARKSAAVRDLPLALIDATKEEELVPLLVRLLTTFGWGEPSSEFLRQGVQNYFTGRSVNSIYRTYGLGDLFFSLEDIGTLERKDNYPIAPFSHFYDEFDSPNAPAGLSLSLLSQIINTKEKRTNYLPSLTVEATSFVSFLLDEFGPETLKAYWETTSLSRGSREIVGMQLDSLEENWLSYVEEIAGGTVRGKYYRGLYQLFEGKFGEARDILSNIKEQDNYYEQALFQLGKIHLFQREVLRGYEQFSRLDTDGLDPVQREELPVFKKLSESFLDGRTYDLNGVVIIVPEGEMVAEEALDRLNYVLKRGKEVLGSKEAGDSPYVLLLTPAGPPAKLGDMYLPERVAFAREAADLKDELASLFIDSLTRTPTYSGLLRQGLAYYLQEGNLESQARNLLSDDNWKPLDALVVNESSPRETIVEAGLLVGYLIREYGTRTFRQIYYSTTPLGGDNSLKGTLLRLIGKDLETVERNMLNGLRPNDGLEGPEE